MQLCTRCGRSNPPDAKFCQDCGAPLQAANRSVLVCPACGSENPPDSRFCQRCGVRIQDADQAVASGTRTTCPLCGKMTPAGFAFCQYCGSRLEETQDAEPPVQPTPPAGIPRFDTAGWTVGQGRRQHDTVSGQVAPPALAAGRSGPLLEVMDLTMTERTVYEVDELPFDVGRSEGHVTFPEDPYLSARHLRIQAAANGYEVVDLNTANGVYLQIRSKTLLGSPAWILMGTQVLRLELLQGWEIAFRPAYWHGVRLLGTKAPRAWGRLVVVSEAGTPLDLYYLAKPRVILGASEGDIQFAHDPVLSRRHAALSFDGRSCLLEDLDSEHGTFVRIDGPTTIRSEDVLRVGVHLLRFRTRGKMATGT